MTCLLPPLALCAALMAGAAQQPPPQQPPARQPPAQQPQPPSQDPPPPVTFRSEVDLVAVDVNIVDDTGAPIADLEAPDFVLEVDGKPRKVASVQYVPSVRGAEAGEAPPAHYSTNERSAGGRMIMLVVDQGNIGVGRGRVALRSAARFVSRLSPNDRVGLATLPGAGPQIDFTEHHALVQTMLGKVVGQNSEFRTQYRMGVTEAAEIQRGNQLMLVEVTNRECAGLSGNELMICQRQISTDALTLYTMSRERARNSLLALRHLLERLALTPSQKTIIYISEGLVIDRELTELAWIADAAIRAQAVIYVLQLDTPMFDAEIARPSPTTTEDRLMNEEGLGMLAGFTRGALMRVLGNADSAFSRLSLELSGYYLLSFEPEPGDRDGKPHKIKVRVPGRRGVNVRSRAEFVVGAPRVRSAEEVLTETLRAPLLANEIPLRLATYTLRDPSADRLRVLFSAEIDRAANRNERVSLAYVLMDAKGAVIGSQIIKDLEDSTGEGSETQSFVASLPAGPPGMYTVKIAVVDESGRRGSVEHTFHARLANAGPLRVADLLIGERSGPRARGVAPAVVGDISADTLHGYVELYADTDAALENAAVAIEIASTPDSRAIESVEARLVSGAEAPNRRTAEAVVPVALLPPGDYVARAVVSVGGRETGRVLRPFRIPPQRVVRTSGPLSRTPGARPIIPFISQPDKFERSSVLAPPVVGFFMERMDFGATGAANGAQAIAAARAGQFETAIGALESAGTRDLATTFLAGLSQYAKGDLEGAALKFRQALRLNSSFFPAAFYLGACYAAGGRDRQAVGAWQTSLVTESDAPFIYTLLADAYVRLRELPSAQDILVEARALWPDSDQVQLRLGTVLALQGKGPEALAILQPYLDQHPEDHERHFVLLRLLYEARQAGGAVTTPAQDRQLFEHHAAAYARAGGKQTALLDEWRKVLK